MDYEDSPIESERGTRNQINNTYVVPSHIKQQRSITTNIEFSTNPFYQQPPSRFENIVKKVSNRNPTPNKSPVYREQGEMTEKQASQILLRSTLVTINSNEIWLKGQVVLGLTGLRYIIKLGAEGAKWINISWIHSLKRMDRKKLLILYYYLNPLLKDKKPSIEPQIIEFSDRQSMEEYWQALTVLMAMHKDTAVERLFHQLL